MACRGNGPGKGRRKLGSRKRKILWKIKHKIPGNTGQIKAINKTGGNTGNRSWHYGAK